MHKSQIAHRRLNRRQHLHRLRSLQRQQRARLPPRNLTVRQTRAQLGKIGVLAGGIDDHIKILRAPRQHQIIINPALRVHQQRITLLADGKPLQIHRQEAFQTGGDVRATHQHLPHMRNVEQSGVLARPEMLLDDAFLILHRHRVAREGDDFRAAGDVPAVECGVFFCAHVLLPCERIAKD